MQEVLFILSANLSQIEEKWDDGRLRSVGLGPQHVIGLVRFRPFHYTLSF